MSLPLHCPDLKHILVTFPVELVYPVWHEYEQLDPYVRLQEGFNSTAVSGVTSGGQVTTDG